MASIFTENSTFELYGKPDDKILLYAKLSDGSCFWNNINLKFFSAATSTVGPTEEMNKNKKETKKSSLISK